MAGTKTELIPMTEMTTVDKKIIKSKSDLKKKIDRMSSYDISP